MGTWTWLPAAAATSTTTAAASRAAVKGTTRSRGETSASESHRREPVMITGYCVGTAGPASTHFAKLIKFFFEFLLETKGGKIG